MMKKISLFLLIAGTGTLLSLDDEVSLEQMQQFLAIKDKKDALAFKQIEEPKAKDVTPEEWEYLQRIKEALTKQQAGNLKEAAEMFDKITSGTK